MECSDASPGSGAPPRNKTKKGGCPPCPPNEEKDVERGGPQETRGLQFEPGER